MKKILFVCGTGGITSTIAENYVKKACQERGIAVDTVRCSPMEISLQLSDADLIVSTTTLGENYPIPVVKGIALLTGINKEAVINQIVQILEAAKRE